MVKVCKGPDMSQNGMDRTSNLVGCSPENPLA